MIAHKRAPRLRPRFGADRTRSAHVPPDRARRHSNAEFHEQFGRDPLFTPIRRKRFSAAKRAWDRRLYATKCRTLTTRWKRVRTITDGR